MPKDIKKTRAEYDFPKFTLFMFTKKNFLVTLDNCLLMKNCNPPKNYPSYSVELLGACVLRVLPRKNVLPGKGTYSIGNKANRHREMHSKIPLSGDDT